MSASTVTRNCMDAARAPIDESAAGCSTSVLLEGALYADPVTCQRALAALIADELIAVEAWAPVNVIELNEGLWVVDVPGAAGAPHGVVVVPRIMGRDIDLVRWELFPRALTGGPEEGAHRSWWSSSACSRASCTTSSHWCAYPQCPPSPWRDP